MKEMLNFRIISRCLLAVFALASAAGCRYQPVWEITPQVTVYPTDTLTPEPTLTATSFFPTAVSNSGVCQSLTEAMYGRWTPVNDTLFGYSFEIPITWKIDTGQGENILIVYSDPNAANTANSELPCGLFRVDLVVESVMQWVGWAPDTGAQPVTVDGKDGWRLDYIPQVVTSSAMRTAKIYFSAGEYFYFLTFQYAPAAGSTAADPATTESLFNDAVSAFLNTFKTE